MNTESIQGQKVNDLRNPGDFSFDSEFTHFYFILPGNTRPDCIHIQKGGRDGERIWGWDGNEEKPTITPSIHSINEWHGYVTEGRFVSC